MLLHLAHSFWDIEARGGFTSHGDAEKERKDGRYTRSLERLRAVFVFYLILLIKTSHVDKPRFKGGINTNRVKKRCHWCNLPLRPKSTRKR